MDVVVAVVCYPNYAPFPLTLRTEAPILSAVRIVEMSGAHSGIPPQELPLGEGSCLIPGYITSLPWEEPQSNDYPVDIGL